MEHNVVIRLTAGCGLTGHQFASAPHLKTDHLAFPQVVHDWGMKGLGNGMSTRVCVTGHTKDPVHFLLKRVGIMFQW